MPDVLAQSGQLDGPTLTWVRAFFAVRGWAIGEAPPTDPALALQVAALERVRRARDALVAAPPDGLPQVMWQSVAFAEQVVQAALSRGDARGARDALKAMLDALKAVTSFRADGATGGGKPPVDGVYKWHPIDTPQSGRSTMGLRTIGNQDGTLAGIKLAGRPRGKHGGAQGQHVAAFVTIREAAVSATHGRTPDEARQNVQHLFKGLLAYPAFGPNAPDPGPDPEILATIRGLSRGDDDVWARFTLDQALAYYVEVRDGLPGASLPRDAHRDTDGKGEAAAVAKIAAFDGGAAIAGCDQAAADRLLLELSKLLDEGAVTKLADPRRQQHTRESFVLGIAQAFPRVFNCPVLDARGRVVGTVGDQLAANQGVAANIATIGASCAALPHPQPPGPRPKTENFSVGVEQTDPTKPLRLDFTGRPAESVKDGAAMGDHTCSMRLMSGAVSTALIGGDTNLPLKGDLADRTAQLLVDFNPAVYVGMYPPPPRVAANIIQIDELASYRVRLEQMGQIHAILTAMQQELAQDRAARTTPQVVAEVAEMVMRLVDMRPTAVSYIGGTSKGKGEGTAGGEVDRAEALIGGGGQVADAATLKKNLLKLFDVRSATISWRAIGALDSVQADYYLTRIVAEFDWFAIKSYPECVDLLGADVLHAEVRQAIMDTDPTADEGDGGFVDEDDDGEPPPPLRPPSGRVRTPSKRKVEAMEDGGLVLRNNAGDGDAIVEDDDDVVEQKTKKPRGR